MVGLSTLCIEGCLRFVKRADLDYTIESSVELPVKLVEIVVDILEADPMDEDLVYCRSYG